MNLMNNQKILILKGLPGSGKSTWAKEEMKRCPNVYKRVNKDDLRSMINDGVYSKEREKQIIEIRDILIDKYLTDGFSVIVDDTNFAEFHDKNIRDKFATRAVIKVVEFNTDIWTCIENDKLRPNPVGEKVIYRMYTQYIRDKKELISNDGLPTAFIVDLDGTLCIKYPGRSYYDCTDCDKDFPHPVILDLIYRYQYPKEDNYQLIFVSGRNERFRAQTEKFLVDTCRLCDFILYMREDDDNRPDDIVKEEIYHGKIEQKYAVQFVIDDRWKVVKMWKQLGLTVLNVGDSINF